MARKSKYTPEVIERILQAIQLGATYELAAQYGGITYKTLNEWMNAKSELCDAIKGAEGKAVVGWLARIEQAAKEGAWQAAAWKLERRYPSVYGKTVSINVTGLAERIAAEMDVPVFDVIAEADRMLVQQEAQG